jgi:methylglutamate dehydrogenase subunit A
VVVAPGPWIPRVWRMLGLEPTVEVAGETRPLVSYLKAQEGEFELRGAGLSGAGADPPVVHLDASEPLRSDRDGRVLVDGAWGIYFRIGRGGVTGGGLPVVLTDPQLDPYGWDNPDHVAEAAFPEFFTSGLAAALGRFRGRADDWRVTANGGIVPHTPDNYPVCDWVTDNVYAIVDSGHGFKALAIGRLVADDVLDGGEPLLDAFRLDRFAQGATHAASKGPYPWT